ncbi:hypothetical protein M501DRAFT_1013973 [Patellaria atrata CBS 101060]|uniref:Uncharacterized protein n=1 Tax=Patellaria atrata CBS 101060 TaxID=1346257 RepID=A0A9P4SE91_9PEZI|nr:hypothetical protein M501DRAFT_1013973 [Patellaria atrata CBS 101060]
MSTQTSGKKGTLITSGEGTSKVQPPKLEKQPTRANSSTPQILDGTVSNTAITEQTRRRRPRKLKINRLIDPPANSSVEKSSDNFPTPTPALGTEIEVLKEKLQQVEGQVEDLYRRLSAASLKSPRRRGRKKKLNDQGEPQDPESLAKDIEAAQLELETLLIAEAERSRTCSPHTASVRAKGIPEPSPDEEIEEIVRNDDLGTASDSAGNVRGLTLSGSYRLPLPTNVSMEHVRAIQNGISSANAVARGILDARRANPQEQKYESSHSMQTSGPSGSSWSEWIGGYSMSVARIVNNIRVDAVIGDETLPSRVHQQNRRSVEGRTTSASVASVQPAIQGRTSKRTPRKPAAKTNNSG